MEPHHVADIQQDMRITCTCTYVACKPRYRCPIREINPNTYAVDELLMHICNLRPEYAPFKGRTRPRSLHSHTEELEACGITQLDRSIT
jgi:hypothetical protein